jgi:transposase
MTRRSWKPSGEPIDVDGLRALVARARDALSPEDAEALSRAIDQLQELRKALHERTATLSRLRRLFHFTSSEKTSAVFGEDASSSSCSTTAGERDGDESSEPTSSNQEGATPPEDGAVAMDTEARKPRRGKNSGRTPSAAYAKANKISVPHEHLRVGDLCPDCGHGKLCRRAKPRRIIGVNGSAALVASSWELESLRCSGCGEIYTATPPAAAVEAESEKYSETAAAILAYLHYGAGMPFHRLAKMQARLQTPVPSSTQWDVVRKRVAQLLPVYEVLLDTAAQARLLHVDDTYVRVTSLMGKRRADAVANGTLKSPERTGLFTTNVIATYGAHQIALFFSGRQHAGENLEALLKRRPAVLEIPTLMSDALSRNVPAERPVTEANCLAHGRRDVVDEVENFPKECRRILDDLGAVFAHDAEARRLKLSDQQRMKYLQEHAGPVLGHLRKWMRQQLRDRRVEDNSGLGAAIRYLLRHWSKLTLFLRRPGVPLSNNISERALKMIILQRKNSYFFRSLEGARVADVYTSLIHTCELAGINPVDYLTELLRHALEVAESPADWLPWRYAETLAKLHATPAAAAA